MHTPKAAAPIQAWLCAPAQVVEQLDLALSMSASERAARLKKDYKFVTDNSTSTWLKVLRLCSTVQLQRLCHV